MYNFWLTNCQSWSTNFTSGSNRTPNIKSHRATQNDRSAQACWQVASATYQLTWSNRFIPYWLQMSTFVLHMIPKSAMHMDSRWPFQTSCILSSIKKAFGIPPAGQCQSCQTGDAWIPPAIGHGQRNGETMTNKGQACKIVLRFSTTCLSDLTLLLWCCLVGAQWKLS